MYVIISHIACANSSFARGLILRKHTAFVFEKSIMPFVHTYLHQDTPTSLHEPTIMAIHNALVSGIGMPQDELFNMLHLYNPAHFFYSRTFNVMVRSDNALIVEITMRRGRSDAMKRTLYQHIADNLTALGHRADDLFIFMHENDYSDWSVGQGKFAMALQQQSGDMIAKP
jgi:Tautomerase enzyme